MKKKTYSIPEVDCTSVNTREMMLDVSMSVGGGGDQNGFGAPKRSGVDINE